MLAELSLWDLSTLVAKVIIYAAMAAAIGTAWVSWLGQQVSGSEFPSFSRKVASQQGWAALAGLLGLSVFFLLQVGVINQQGIAGMFDPTMASVIAASSIGEGLRLKAAGFMCAAAAAIVAYIPVPPRKRKSNRYLAVLISAAGAVLLAWSFSVLGHVANLDPLSRFAIAVHVIAISLWVGSLYPLYRHLNTEPVTLLGPVLHRFGQFAWLIIAALLIAGVYLATRLLGSLDDLISTAYGLALLLKIVLVAALLALGAINKFRLVPALERDASLQPLRRAIAFEMLLALLVLLLSAWLTTVVGPEMAM
jgi:copper resistance protein D